MGTLEAPDLVGWTRHSFNYAEEEQRRRRPKMGFPRMGRPACPFISETSVTPKKITCPA